MAENRTKGLLVVSFGTSVAETRAKTIDALDGDLKEAFPDRAFYRAWSSRFILKKVREKEGLEIDNVSEALLRMSADGITDLLVQPTYIGPGKEYDLMLACLKEYRDRFGTIRVGRPLLMTETDRREAAELVKTLFPQVKASDRLVLMGHGVPDGDNSVYHDMNRQFESLGLPNVFMGLVEAEPSLDEVREWLGSSPQDSGRTVWLTPFLIVAGDHALNDMAGDEPDSWKETLKADGFEVNCILKGLGEYEEIRKTFEWHAREAETLS